MVTVGGEGVKQNLESRGVDRLCGAGDGVHMAPL